MTITTGAATRPRTHRGGRRPALALSALLAVLVMALAGCGGSAGSSGNSGDSGSGGSASQAQLDKAHQAVESAKKGPDAIPALDPLPAPPKSGQTVIYLSDGSASATQYSAGVQEAAGATHWTYKQLQYNLSDPGTLVAALKDALRFKPAAVVFAALPYQLWQSVVPDYKAAGVPIVTLNILDTPQDNPLIIPISASSSIEGYGKLMGYWAIDHSQGKAQALIVSLSGFQSQTVLANTIVDTLKNGCSGCSSQVLNVSISQMVNNQIPQLIVAEMRKNPKINYVLGLAQHPVTGAPEAVKAAGLSASWGTYFSDEVTQQSLLKGTADAGFPYGYRPAGWLAVDAAARHLDGVNLPLKVYADYGMNYIVTKDNVTDPKELPELPAGYQDQFKKVWGVS